EIGAAGNDGLQGLARALRADILEHEVVPLEDARVLAQRRRLVLPIVDLADRDLEVILRARRRRGEADQHSKRQAEAQRMRCSVKSHRGVLLLSHLSPRCGLRKLGCATEAVCRRASLPRSKAETPGIAKRMSAPHPARARRRSPPSPRSAWP